MRSSVRVRTHDIPAATPSSKSACRMPVRAEAVVECTPVLPGSSQSGGVRAMGSQPGAEPHARSSGRGRWTGSCRTRGGHPSRGSRNWPCLQPPLFPPVAWRSCCRRIKSVVALAASALLSCYTKRCATKTKREHQSTLTEALAACSSSMRGAACSLSALCPPCRSDGRLYCGP
jgi:hypothetical protein